MLLQARLAGFQNGATIIQNRSATVIALRWCLTLLDVAITVGTYMVSHRPSNSSHFKALVQAIWKGDNNSSTNNQGERHDEYSCKNVKQSCVKESPSLVCFPDRTLMYSSSFQWESYSILEYGFIKRTMLLF